MITLHDTITVSSTFFISLFIRAAAGVSAAMRRATRDGATIAD